jgi:hypothetical protein
MKISLRRVFRYSLLALAILFVLWVLAITAVYFLVDADDIKKLAVSAVNENTKGELSIGEIKLKVFPLVHFEIKDLLMKSSEAFKRKEVFSCESSKLSFNVLTLIFGKPKITLVLRKPTLNVLSDGKKTNLDDLFEPSKKSSSPDFLTYLFVSKMYFDIRSAYLSYTAPADKFNINGLDLSLEVEPVSRRLILVMKSPIDYKKGTTLVNGNINLNANVKMRSQESTEVSVLLDANGLNIETESFKKSRGDVLKVELLGDTDIKDKINIKALDIYLIDKLFSGSGVIKAFLSDSPELDLKAKIGPYDVKNFAKLSSLAKDLGVSGLLKSDLSIKGVLPLKEPRKQSSNLNISLEFDGSELVVNSKSFKKQQNVYLGLLLKASASAASVNISELSGGIGKIKFKALGSVNGLDKKYPSYNLNLDLPKFMLSSLAEFFPALSKHPVSGELYLKLKTAGAVDPLPVISAEAGFSDTKNKNDLKLNINSFR